MRCKPSYYNENDEFCAQWLRNLIAAGHIPPGDVDDRSILDVRASDLRGYGQCHFFAGIGGFGLACRLAGIPDDAEIWTGGFPCQPFSVAGRQRAQQDDRHLWPVLHGLIEQARPAIFVGENVAGIIDLALDGVHFDLEASGYASRTFVVPACAVNAPHRRDRVWIAARSVADTAASGGRRRGVCGPDEGLGEDEKRASGEPSGRSEGDCDVADVGANPWAGAEYRQGADGKARRIGTRVRKLDDGVSGSLVGVRAGAVETIPLLVKGVPDRVAKLKAFGNAIVPQVAAEIIKAVMAQN